MKIRKTRYLVKVLKKKGFELYPEKDHHQYYYLTINGLKYPVYTYFSHSLKEYSSDLMSEIKKQLNFPTSKQAENFFDCPMSAKQYVELLVKNGIISLD